VSLSRILRVTVCGALFAFLAAPVRLSGQAASPQEKKAKHELPTRAVSAVLGDFDVLKKRRVIRLLVVYNKTNYFIDKGTPRGITYDAFKLFEDELNKKYKTGNLRIHVTFIPVARATHMWPHSCSATETRMASANSTMPITYIIGRV